MGNEHIDLVKEYKMASNLKIDELKASKYTTKRVQIKDGKIDLNQLGVLSKIALKYSKGLDFTTKQNIQFREVSNKDISDIDKVLNGVKLAFKPSSHSFFQLTNSCPTCRIDKNELLDIKDILEKTNIYFRKNHNRYSNFSKRVKMSISTCGNFCTTYEIHDIAFTAFKSISGEVLFDLTIGGGLSRLKQTAVRVQRYIKKEQVVEVAIACADIFNNYISQHNRKKARLMHLLNEWKIEKFIKELELRLPFKLIMGELEPTIVPFEKRNHFGIHKQKEKELFYVGFATNVGRISIEDFTKIYEVCKKYSVGGISLTTTQNFIVYDIKDEFVEFLAKELDSLGFSYNPVSFRARLQSCSGQELCKFGIAETKEFAKSVVAELENRVKDFNEKISITFAGCTRGCSQPYIADIGLVGCLMRYKKQRVAGYELFLGGSLQGAKSVLAKRIGIKVPADKLTDYIFDLISEYKKDNKKASSFKEYLSLIEVKSLEDGE